MALLFVYAVSSTIVTPSSLRLGLRSTFGCLPVGRFEIARVEADDNTTETVLAFSHAPTCEITPCRALRSELVRGWIVVGDHVVDLVTFKKRDKKAKTDLGMRDGYGTETAWSIQRSRNLKLGSE